MGADSRVIGVGYQGETIEDFCKNLQTLGVDSVVDVRLNALSRKRGFSKNGLRSALNDIGITYSHSPELGNARDNRDGFAFPGTSAGDQARVAYSERLETDEARVAVQRIAQSAREGVVALMCFERDESECHRELVLREVARAVALSLSSVSS